MQTVTIRYCFTLPDKSQQIFDLQLDMQNIESSVSNQGDLPSWTNLDFHQCSNCPLTTQTHPNCPLAVNLVGIVKDFEGLVSYDKIHVEITTEERIISQDTTAQRGISSFMGLAIATSGCPHTAFFKSMARYHLPLATEEETVFRATSSYLLAQYFMKKDGRNADLELEGLTKIYEDIQVINRAVADRLRGATKTDSSVNAIILLDAYARAIPYVIEKSLEKIRYVFTPFINPV